MTDRLVSTPALLDEMTDDEFRDFVARCLDDDRVVAFYDALRENGWKLIPDEEEAV